MTPFTTDTPDDDDDLDARTRRISHRILDGIEETLADMAQSHAIQAAIARETLAQCSAQHCRHALCRRAKPCRRQPCAVSAAAFQTS